HDPTALYRFEEHDVYLPMMVLEELDAAKKGTSDVARNARQVSRFLNELIEVNGAAKIHEGLKLVRPEALRLGAGAGVGCLRFQTTPVNGSARFGTVLPDNQILASVLALREAEPDVPVVLVSKDINLRIKASIAGITAEDYENDRALDDFSPLYTGATELPADFWERHEGNLKSWTERGHTYYELTPGEGEQWHPNQYLYLPGGDESVELKVLRARGDRVTLQIVDDFRSASHAVW